MNGGSGRTEPVMEVKARKVVEVITVVGGRLDTEHTDSIAHKIR